jgi:hypothetical protein
VTWYEYACQRFSSFSREQASAVVAYLIFKKKLIAMSGAVLMKRSEIIGMIAQHRKLSGEPRAND